MSTTGGHRRSLRGCEPTATSSGLSGFWQPRRRATTPSPGSKRSGSTSTNTFFITDYREFGEWAEGRKRIRMEDFYRRQRIDLDVLMDGDEPAGGAWNFDHENREPPPKDGRAWPALDLFPLDAIDRDVMTELEASDDVALWGAAPDGRWPVTRAQALERLQRFVDEGLPGFGAHEDAMLAAEWKLAHSVLSSAMNIGLLDPMEVVRAAEVAYRGRAPINSVEGFIRQVMGWREYVWGLYWFFDLNTAPRTNWRPTARCHHRSPAMPPPRWRACRRSCRASTTGPMPITSNG